MRAMTANPSLEPTSRRSRLSFNVKRRKRAMHLLHRFFATSFMLLAAPLFAQSLEKLEQVDLIELDPKTSQIRLLVVLGESRVNTRQAVKALYKKYNNYQDFITSGQALAAAPNGNPKMRPLVVVVGPKEATSGEMQNLDGLKLAASKVGAVVEVIPYVPALSVKPVPISRVLSKSGA
jgi:hypothetical protein